MDLKVNNMSFSGKREILYGLTQASKYAQMMEYGRTAYKGKINDHLVFNASMRAYLDMATKDDVFYNVVRNLTPKDLLPIKENLKEFVTQHGILKPFGIFKDALENVIKTERNNSETKKAAFKELIKLFTV